MMRSRAETESPSVALGGLAALIGYHIAQARLVTNRAFARHVGDRFALRRVEFSMLVLLDANGPLAPKTLARVLSLSPPNLSLLLERLHKRGLVRREPNPEDGRSQLIMLTAAGRQTASAAAGAAQRMEDDLQASLSRAEHAMLIELLAKLAAASPERNA